MSNKCSSSLEAVKRKRSSSQAQKITRSLSVVARDFTLMPYLSGTYKHNENVDCPDMQACSSIVFHHGTRNILHDNGMCSMILPMDGHKDLIVVCQPCKRFFLQMDSYVAHLRSEACVPHLLEPASKNFEVSDVSTVTN